MLHCCPETDVYLAQNNWLVLVVKLQVELCSPHEHPQPHHLSHFFFDKKFDFSLFVSLVEPLSLLFFKILCSTRPFSHFKPFSVICLNVLRHYIYSRYLIWGIRFSVKISTCSTLGMWHGHLQARDLQLCKNEAKISLSLCLAAHKSIRVTRLLMLWENLVMNCSTNSPHDLIFGDKWENHSKA